MGENEVVVLGAGFSRAVSRHMPLTDELGKAALKRAGLARDSRVPAAGFQREFTFEEWLSILAEKQPYLSASDNLDNAALFSRLTESLGEVLAEDVVASSEQTPPEWFYMLLGLLHYRRATVITFNYDTLVELGVVSHRLAVPSLGGSRNTTTVRPGHILMASPPLPNAIKVPDVSWLQRRTFRLLKLHGSIDWWAVPDDPTGATLNREPMEGTFGSYHLLDEPSRRYLLPGRDRFIVPPSTVKSAYYTNPLVRELWREARTAMRGATRISFLGYSFPRVDSVMTSMVESAIRGSRVAFEIADLHPEVPRQRLLGLGAEQGSVVEYSGVDAIEKFTRALAQRASKELVEWLRGRTPDNGIGTRVLLSWGVPKFTQTGIRIVAAVLPPDVSGVGEIALELSPGANADATGARFGPDGSVLSTSEAFFSLRDLILAVRTDRVKALEFRTGGNLVPLVASWYESRETGASNRWIALSPSGRQRK
jgi:hypothetical protein